MKIFVFCNFLSAIASALIDDQRTAIVDRIRLNVFYLNKTEDSKFISNEHNTAKKNSSTIESNNNTVIEKSSDNNTKNKAVAKKSNSKITSFSCFMYNAVYSKEIEKIRRYSISILSLVAIDISDFWLIFSLIFRLISFFYREYFWLFSE